MVTCTVREIRRAGGRSVSPVSREKAVVRNEVVELPLGETGLGDRSGERPSAVTGPSGPTSG